MPLLRIADTTCYYRLEGAEDRPLLVLAHALGQDHGMWAAQVADLAPHFRVLRYDIRGHGASAATPGEYSVDRLGHDILALADALDAGRFAFCGLSLGGMIGLWLAARAPERLTALVLANTSARPEAERMEERRRAVLAGGMAAVAETVMSRYFSPRALAEHPPDVATARRTLLATDPGGYAGCCAAIRDLDLTEALERIRVPTLVINGIWDRALPFQDHGARLAHAIPGARAVHLRAAHLSNLEAPRAFTAALLDFLLPASEPAFDAGLRVRRAALGDEHVDRAMATAASGDFQRLITQFAWGGVWARPRLDLRARRRLALAITAALGRWEEFRLHVRAGLSRELEWCDLEELLLQAAIYAGVPVANAAFQIAAEERERQQPPDEPG
ncbi:MAG TPA: 3-oxoadipate enol-lactonase [Vicinamibacterales bacterium]|nr:3-oxoadipate enol-lactonase [Vicinamibacterales bacterium]